MTVTKGKKTISFPVGSGNASDVDLGSVTPSDTESLRNEPRRAFVPSTLKPIKAEEPINLKKHSGRRKLRRYQNLLGCLLQTLAEENDDDESYVVIMEPYQSPFAKLLQDEDALQFWNNFIDKSEEEQARVVAAFTEMNKKHQQLAKPKPYSRISAKIKRTIKIKKNLSLEQVKESENDLIAFFKKTPTQVYSKLLPTYFERLILHAIAQYHGLASLGMMDGGAKRVEVYNTINDWNPADCFLTDFVAQLRK